MIDRLSALDNVLLAFADERSPFSILPWSKTLERRAVEALREVGLLHLAHSRAGNLTAANANVSALPAHWCASPNCCWPMNRFLRSIPPWPGNWERVQGAGQTTCITLVVVLHQIDIARTLADRIVGLTRDGIAFDAPPDEFSMPPTTDFS